MTDFEWPWEYSFPPFFTFQPNSETRKQQFLRWKELILQYQRYRKQAILNLNDDTELFNNDKINRRLDKETKTTILDEMCVNKNAAAVGKNSGIYEIYWLTLEEWSNVVYNWAQNSGMTNSVLTQYELLNGDDTKDEEFSGLNEDVFMKVMKLLESKGKCEVMEIDGSYGVKFF
ncbi:unnamed protein product [Diamesa serratosioi]